MGGAAYSRKNEPPREWHLSHVRPSLFLEGPPTCAFGFCIQGPSLPGAVKHFSVLHSFRVARKALNGPKRRFRARAAGEESNRM